ncbi:MAG: ATP-binding cassette domain-containing protein [Eubacteriales bacterium]|nr:ATP-binding cassette domain-containing protein [Eubacteriales bacterium]
MSEEKEVLLRVENLCQFFGRPGRELKAVNNVSFDIHRGEVFGLVGESGCGKTTTGRTIIKLYNATSGNVYFKGRRIVAGTRSYTDEIAALKKESAKADEARKAEIKARIAELKKEIKKAKHDQKCCDKDYAREQSAHIEEEYAKRKQEVKTEEEAKALEEWHKDQAYRAKKQRFVTGIQMIFQDSIASLDPRMTVREIIAEGLRIHGVRNKKEIDEQVYSVLERVGLVREHAGRYPHEFSGGQRQRIGISRAIVMKPDLIIADEPISALDVSIQAQVINLMNDLCHDLGLTILFIAHDLSVVKYFSDRIGVMYYGNLVELAESDELFAHPLHPYTRSLLSDIPRPDPLSEKSRVHMVYNKLTAHDYSVERPSFREVTPGHFVLCSDSEEKKYLEEIHGTAQ